MKEEVQGLAGIAELIFSFAQVKRVTLYPDGETFESDTDHTVMLSVVACALASKLYKDRLDIGKVAQFAIVHDIVEAYAGDTDTFGITEEGKIAKDAREHEALTKLQDKFQTSYPWLPNTVIEYERLDTEEAKFVKVVDKLMSKLTHILNNGALFKKRNTTPEEMETNYIQLISTLEGSYGKNFPEMIELLHELMVEAKRRTYA